MRHGKNATCSLRSFCCALFGAIMCRVANSASPGDTIENNHNKQIGNPRGRPDSSKQHKTQQR
eukprot:scaffold17185_cov56-Attheya_sp.AAC.8